MDVGQWHPALERGRRLRALLLAKGGRRSAVPKRREAAERLGVAAGGVAAQGPFALVP